MSSSRSSSSMEQNIDDPSSRSESSPNEGSQSEKSLLTTSPPTSSDAFSDSSNYQSATETPSKSKSYESFHSAMPAYSTEQTIAEYDNNFPLKRSKSETDVDFETDAAASNSSAGESKKYLDEGDYLTTNKLLGKLCKTMVESSCHNGKKQQEFNQSLDKLEKTFADNISVLNDFVIDFDLKTANRIEEMVDAIDPQMSLLEDIASLSSALDSLEGWLDLTGDQNERDLDTMEIAKQNLIKERALEKEAEQLDEQSIKCRAIFDALELDDPRMLRHALAASNKSANPLHYGVKENKNFVPEFMVDLVNLEKNISEMKQFLVECHLLPRNYFDKMESLMADVKAKMSESMEPLSAASSFSSLLSIPSEDPIAYCTSDYEYVPSASNDCDDNGEIEIEVSRSATSRSISETSVASSNITSDSTQTSSIGNDTVESTQASSGSYGSVESTQASNTSDSPLSTCPSYDMECDTTQNSGASCKTAISPHSSSLKTAMSLHDVISSDSLDDSSSTIAI